MEVTEHERTVFATKVHAVAFTIAEERTAVARLNFLHPSTVAIRLEAFVPHVPEMVAVYVALIVLSSDRGAGTDAAVYEYRCNRYAGSTLVEVVTHPALVVRKETFATVTYMSACFTLGGNEIKHTGELFVSEKQLRVVLGPAHRVYTEQTPVAYTQLPEIIS